MKEFFGKERKTILLLLAAVFFAFLISYLSMKDNSIAFWFDQSRDAHLASKIIEDHDLKILGPSASGTNDAVYHGVLYYYFLAPLYYFGHGNPMVPAMVLSFLGCLGIIPLYYFSKRFFSSTKIAWITVFGYVFSVEIIQLSSWLSNPSLAVVPLIIFYWSLWEVGFKNNKAFIIPLAISMGISLQAALWLIYLFGPLLVALLYNYEHFSKKSVLRDWKSNIIFISIVFLLVSSILIGQLMLWKNGIFSLEGLGLSEKITNTSILIPLFKVYFSKIIQTIGPYTPVVAFLILMASISGFTQLPKNNRIFLISWILGPFWLFLIEPRNSIHILISLELAIILILSFQVTQIWQKKSFVSKLIAATLIGVYVFSNLMMFKNHKDTSSNIFSPQQGTNLADQLSLIDYTYAKASGGDFTFSAFTNPHGYYITWAYLYDWYGQKKYGYKPTFVGPNQSGLFGEELLLRDDVSRAKIHFTIVEPDLEVLPQITRDLFIEEQNRLAPIVETKMFGSTKIEFRPI